MDKVVVTFNTSEVDTMSMVKTMTYDTVAKTITIVVDATNVNSVETE